MRTIILCWLVSLIASITPAQTVPYDQISADAVGFAYGDVAHGFASRICQLEINGSTIRKNAEWAISQKEFISSATSLTIYALGKQGSPVVLIRGSTRQFLDEIEQPRRKDLVIFTYGRQEVHFSSACLLPEMFGNGKSVSTDEEPRNQISMGVGGEGSRFHGSFYTAYVGQDLIILTLDLPSMATALDVLNSVKPSLATQDPHGLKAPTPPGVFLIGAGMSAQWNADLPKGVAGSTTQTSASSTGDFGLDFLGSFKGKAQIARIDFGENDTDDFADASITMADPDTAGHLTNVLLGIKALISLSKAEAIPYLNPLTIQANGKDVRLHWAMPTEKLFELVKQESEASGAQQPPNHPTTQPAR